MKKEFIGFLVFLSVVGGVFASTNSTERILLWDTGFVESKIDEEPVTRWDYSGPVLGSWGIGGNDQLAGGLKVTFPIGDMSSIAKDIKRGTKIIYDEFRSYDAVYASLVRQYPECFYAADGEVPEPLPAEAQERLDNAQADGPGFFSRPSTYLTGGAAAVGAWWLSDQNSNDGGPKTAINVQDSQNVAVNTGRGTATASQATAPPPEPVIIRESE